MEAIHKSVLPWNFDSYIPMYSIGSDQLLLFIWFVVQYTVQKRRSLWVRKAIPEHFASQTSHRLKRDYKYSACKPSGKSKRLLHALLTNFVEMISVIKRGWWYQWKFPDHKEISLYSTFRIWSFITFFFTLLCNFCAYHRVSVRTSWHSSTRR